MKQKLENVEEICNKMENPMKMLFISKITLSSGAVGAELEKSAKLLEMLVDGRKAQIIKSGPKTRIPAFNVKPKMELGARITVRKGNARVILKKLLGAIENTLKRRQVGNNTFSFGIKEYIEIPGVEYAREIGIRGLNVSVSFERKGFRVKKKKIKMGNLPLRQMATKEEIIKFMEENFNTKFVK